MQMTPEARPLRKLVMVVVAFLYSCLTRDANAHFMSVSLSWNDTSTADSLAEILRSKFEIDEETPRLIADLVLNILQSEKKWEDRKYVFCYRLYWRLTSLLQAVRYPNTSP